MRIAKILFCLLVLITVTATYGQRESHKHDNDLYDSKTVKRVVKRDASLIIDSYPLESMVRRSPRVVIKRVSSSRHSVPTKYGPPTKKGKRGRRPHQKKLSKKPIKYPPSGYKKRAPKPRNVRPRPKAKYGPPKPKYGPPKPKYGPPKPKYGPPKPKYGPPKPKHVIPQSFKAPEPDGFATPPAQQQDIYPPNPDNAYPPQDIFPPNSDNVYSPQDIFPPNSENAYAPRDIFPPKPDNGEPPVDSYGAPLRPPTSYSAADDSIPASQFYGNHDNQEDHALWPDHKLASSNKHQVYARPDSDMDLDDEQMPIDFDDDIESHHHLRMNLNHNLVDAEKKKPPRAGVSHRFTSRPWKQEENDHKILVGGQYAEPPAKYVAEDDNFVPPGFIDSEIPASATMSPYVNYKNSNMAFSPQNLNDAFSLIDK